MSLFDALSISASGMAAQRLRSQLLVENIANAETTRTAGGGPYRRKDAVFTATSVGNSFGTVLDSALQPTGVRVADIVVDARDPELRYLPGHPDADPSGYVAFPRVNAAEEMVDLMSAGRSYEANVAAISALKDMILRSLDILK